MKKGLLIIVALVLFGIDIKLVLGAEAITIKDSKSESLCSLPKFEGAKDVTINGKDIVSCFKNVSYSREDNKITLKRAVDKVEDQSGNILLGSNIITVIDFTSNNYIIYVNNEGKLWVSSVYKILESQVLEGDDDYYISLRFLAESLKASFDYDGAEIMSNFDQRIVVKSLEKSISKKPDTISYDHKKVSSPVRDKYNAPINDGIPVNIECGDYNYFYNNKCTKKDVEYCGYICEYKTARNYFLEGGRYHNMSVEVDFDDYVVNYGRPIYGWTDDYIAESRYEWVGNRQNFIASVGFDVCNDIWCNNCYEKRHNQYQTGTLQDLELISSYPQCIPILGWVEK